MATVNKRVQKYLSASIIIGLFIFSVAPILLAAIPGAQTSETYSIFNTGPNGLSVVNRELLSTPSDTGGVRYNTTSIISNLNVLNRFNGSGVLVVVGPAANYDSTEFISLLLFLLRGGSLIIADDFGTGNQILEPLFKAFEGYDKFATSVSDTNPDMQLPTISDILGNAGNSNTSVPSGGGGDTGIPGTSTGGLQADFGGTIMNLIGSVIKRFGFNGSVLMDLQNNNQNPNRPIIVDVDSTDGPYSFTQGVSKVQTEMATIISLQLNVSVPSTDPNAKPTYKTVWQPLTKLSFAELSGQDLGSEVDIFRFLDFLFPLYSSKDSWIETDMKAAAEGTATADLNEWGNAQFSLALNLPMFPGGGKIVFLADPSIFINKWTSKTTENDNLKMISNLFAMVSNNIEGSNVPIIFDFGHTYQGPLSPALYSTALMKLIANLSMFPLLAPFVPLTAYSFGKKLIPKTQRLRPILLTKRRGERGQSTFDKKLYDIKLAGTYGEPIMHLSRRLIRLVQKDVRFTGQFAKNPVETSEFYASTFPGQFNRRELRRQLDNIFRIAKMPTRPLTRIQAKTYLTVLRRLISLLE